MAVLQGFALTVSQFRWDKRDQFLLSTALLRWFTSMGMGPGSEDPTRALVGALSQTLVGALLALL